MWPAFYAACLLPILARIPGSGGILRTSRSLGTVFETLQTAPPHALLVPFWLYPRAKFVCRHAGLFPDDNNCKIFYKCNSLLFGHFARHIYKCKDHYLYSIEMEACVPAEQVNRIECQNKIIVDPPQPLPMPPIVLTNPPQLPPKPQIVVTNPPQTSPRPHIQPDVQHRTEIKLLPRKNQTERTTLLVNVSQNGTGTTHRHHTEITPLPRENRTNRTTLLVNVSENGTGTTPQHHIEVTLLPQETQSNRTTLLVDVPQNGTRTTPRHHAEITSLPREKQSNRTTLLVNVSQNGTGTTPRHHTEITPLPRENRTNRTTLLVNVSENGTGTTPQHHIEVTLLPQETQSNRTTLLVDVPQNGTGTTPQHRIEVTLLPQETQSNRTTLLVDVPQNGTRTTPRHHTEITPLPRENRTNRTTLLVNVSENGTGTTPQHHIEVTLLPQETQSNRTTLLVDVPQNGTRTTPRHHAEITSLPRENQLNRTTLLVNVPQNVTGTTPQHHTKITSLLREIQSNRTTLLVNVTRNGIRTTHRHHTNVTSLPGEAQSNRTNLLVNVPENDTTTTLQHHTEIISLPRGNESNRTNLLVNIQKNDSRMIPELGMALPSFYKMHKEISGRFDLFSAKLKQSTGSVRKEPTDLTIDILTKRTPAAAISLATQSTEHVFEKNTKNIISKTLIARKLFEQSTKINHTDTMEPPRLLSTKKSLEHNAKRLYPPTSGLPSPDKILFKGSRKETFGIPPATATLTSTFSETLFDQDSDHDDDDDFDDYDDFDDDFDDDDDDDSDDTRGSVSTEESTNITQELFEQDTENNITEGTTEGNEVEDCVETGFFPDPYNCSKFYRCVDFGSEFVKYQFSCPNGTIWDDSLKSCNFPSQVKRTNACIYFAPTTTTQLPFTIIEPDDSIINLNVPRLTIACPTGFRAHPNYCNMFYQCTTDKRLKINFMVFACPEGTVFHEKKGQCSKNENVTTDPEGCSIFRQKEIPDSIQILNVPNGKLCPDSGQFPDGRTCSSKYFKCTRDNSGDLQGFLLDCSQGHVYSHVANRCVPLFLFPFCMRHYLSTKL